MKTYLHAVSIYETCDVIKGISDFITGSVPGHNPAYAPSAPQVGSAVRRAMERRLEAARLNKIALPPPADDFEQDPPEVRARNKERLTQLIADIGKTIRTDDAEGEQIKRDLQKRTRQRFAPSMEKRDMVERLGIQRYFVGDDPEADDGDMGQRGAA